MLRCINRRNSHRTRVLLFATTFLLVTTLFLNVESSNSTKSSIDLSVEGNQEITTAPDIFEPELEWKEVLPHQQVPGGLHIRMDLSTGKKYAKLITPEITDENHAHASSLQTVSDVQTDKQQSHQTSEAIDETESGVTKMKRVLMSLPDPEPELERALNSQISEKELERILRKVWARRQQDLAEAMSKMKSEADLIQQQLARLQNLSSVDVDMTMQSKREAYLEAESQIVGILNDLEYYVGKIDNARDFVKMGGLETCLMLSNHSSTKVQEAALWTLGTTLKYEKDLQASALQIGVLPTMLQTLRNTARKGLPGAIAYGIRSENDTVMLWKVANKAVYSLGSLLRQNKAAQQEFLRRDGLQMFLRVIDAAEQIFTTGMESDPEAELTQASLTFATKMCVLIGDLIEEHSHSLSLSLVSNDIPSTSEAGEPQLTVQTEAGEFVNAANREVSESDDLSRRILHEIIQAAVIDRVLSFPILMLQTVAHDSERQVDQFEKQTRAGLRIMQAFEYLTIEAARAGALAMDISIRSESFRDALKIPIWTTNSAQLLKNYIATCEKALQTLNDQLPI